MMRPFSAVGVFRMRIGRHVVSPAVAVHEQHPRAGSHGVSFGLTPAAVMVKVFGLDGVGVGVVADDPPHDAKKRQGRTAAARIHMGTRLCHCGRATPFRFDAGEGYWMTMVPCSAPFSGLK